MWLCASESVFNVPEVVQSFLNLHIIDSIFVQTTTKNSLPMDISRLHPLEADGTDKVFEDGCELFPVRLDDAIPL